MTATSQPTFRKTKQGEWVVFGPASIIQTGTVEVSKRDGSSKTVVIDRVGREFTVDDVTCRYGYQAQAQPHAHRSTTHNGRGECIECGAYGPIGQNCRECYEGYFA
jgi:hypothetical protein